MRITCESIRQKHDNLGCEIKIVGGSSLYLNFVSRIICASYLLIDSYLGEGGDIDRVTLPQGKCTPRISVTRCTKFSEFCVDRSIEISP